MPTAAIGPAIGGVTSLLGGILGSGAAGAASAKAAGTLGRNAEQLAQVGGQQLKGQLGSLQPYQDWGRRGFNTLQQMLSTPGQGLLQGYGSFQAPTGVNFQNDPGYQFRLQQGVQALQNSAAARGDLMSGNTLQALTQLGQGLGSEEYGNVYGRALQGYQTNANNYYQNQANQYNRLMGLGGMGLQATGMADQARQNYVNTYGNAMGMSNQGGMAAAQGIMGQNAAWENALGGLGNAGMGYSTLAQLGALGGGGAGGGAGAMMSPSVLQALPYAQPSGAAAYGLGSLSSMGGFGIGGYGQGFPGQPPTIYNQSGYQNGQ